MWSEVNEVGCSVCNSLAQIRAYCQDHDPKAERDRLNQSLKEIGGELSVAEVIKGKLTAERVADKMEIDRLKKQIKDLWYEKRSENIQRNDVEVKLVWANEEIGRLKGMVRGLVEELGHFACTDLKCPDHPYSVALAQAKEMLDRQRRSGG